MAIYDGWTIQSGAEKDHGLRTNKKSYQEFGYFLGGIDVTHQNLELFDPYIQGVSRIFLHRPPEFMHKMYEDETRRFREYIETGYTRIDGIADISVDFVDFEGGFNGDKFSNVSQARDDTDTLTISVYEQSGSPVREYIETWVTGVRDIRSGIAHYHGGLGKTGIEYGEKFHTAEFVYFTLDPTGQTLEYACLFAHCFPTKVPKGHLNYEKGNRENVLMDLDFKTKKYESPAINTVGWYYLNASKVEYNYLRFTPNITGSEIMATEKDRNYNNKRVFVG